MNSNQGLSELFPIPQYLIVKSRNLFYTIFQKVTVQVEYILGFAPCLNGYLKNTKRGNDHEIQSGRYL